MVDEMLYRNLNPARSEKDIDKIPHYSDTHQDEGYRHWRRDIYHGHQDYAGLPSTYGVQINRGADAPQDRQLNINLATMYDPLQYFSADLYPHLPSPGFDPDGTSTPLSQPQQPIDAPHRFDPSHRVVPQQPYVDGILKNSHIEPFYPRPRVEAPVQASRSVMFYQDPVQRCISPSWASSSPPPSTLDTPSRRVYSGPSRFLHGSQAGSTRPSNDSYHMLLPQQAVPETVQRPDSSLPTIIPSDNDWPQTQGLLPALSPALPALGTEVPGGGVIPSTLAHAHQDIIEHRRKRGRGGSIGRQSMIRSSLTNPLWVVNEAVNEVESHPGQKPYNHVLEATKADREEDTDYRYTGTDPSDLSDELNLRSLDIQDAQDWVDHPNYPRQVDYDDSLEESDNLSSAAIAPQVRLTEAAFRFDIPQHVENEARRSRKRPRKNTAKPISAQRPSNRSTKQDLGVSLGSDPIDNLSTSPDIMVTCSKPEEIVEAIQEFSDDGEEMNTMDIDPPETVNSSGTRARQLTPVAEGKEEDMASEKDFFGDGDELGFRVYKDGY